MACASCGHGQGTKYMMLNSMFYKCHQCGASTPYVDWCNLDKLKRTEVEINADYELVSTFDLRGVSVDIRLAQTPDSVQLKTPEGLIACCKTSRETWEVWHQSKIIAEEKSLRNSLWVVVSNYGEGACDWNEVHRIIFGERDRDKKEQSAQYKLHRALEEYRATVITMRCDYMNYNLQEASLINLSVSLFLPRHVNKLLELGAYEKDLFDWTLGWLRGDRSRPWLGEDK